MSQLGAMEKVVSYACAGALFLALLNLPIDYYSVLRVVVFLGALIMIYVHREEPFKWMTFALVGYLFNPIYPIYLGEKVYWILIDILCGLLFLSGLILKKRKKKSTYIPYRKKSTAYKRDKIA